MPFLEYSTCYIKYFWDLAYRFRVFSSKIFLNSQEAATVTLEAIISHTMLREKSREFFFF